MKLSFLYNIFECGLGRSLRRFDVEFNLYLDHVILGIRRIIMLSSPYQKKKGPKVQKHFWLYSNIKSVPNDHLKNFFSYQDEHSQVFSPSVLKKIILYIILHETYKVTWFHLFIVNWTLFGFWYHTFIFSICIYYIINIYIFFYKIHNIAIEFQHYTTTSSKPDDKHFRRRNNPLYGGNLLAVRSINIQTELACFIRRH